VVLTFRLPSSLFAARGEGGAANKLEGKWKVSLCLVAPPQAAAEYGINSSFCWRTTFEDICAVRNFCWFQGSVSADLQSDKWGYAKARNLPGKANAGKK